jgi:hypothetical protein
MLEDDAGTTFRLNPSTDEVRRGERVPQGGSNQSKMHLEVHGELDSNGDGVELCI